jgi:hypothetical protein
VIAVDSSADLLDQIRHATERNMAAGVLERESERLSEVRAVLRRVHIGMFGIRLDSEEEISPKRLAAVPMGFLVHRVPEGRGGSAASAPDRRVTAVAKYGQKGAGKARCAC